jgi:hypothetical protein
MIKKLANSNRYPDKDILLINIVIFQDHVDVVLAVFNFNHIDN